MSALQHNSQALQERSHLPSCIQILVSPTHCLEQNLPALDLWFVVPFVFPFLFLGNLQVLNHHSLETGTTVATQRYQIRDCRTHQTRQASDDFCCLLAFGSHIQCLNSIS
jgi:hypothetical protein